MSKQKLKFQLLGTLANHPDYPDAKPGDVLTLEVGDDKLPTSELLRYRVRPLGQDLGEGGDGMSEDEAKGKAKEIVDKAKAKAADIVKDAEDKAAQILDKANTDAAALMDAAKS